MVWTIMNLILLNPIKKLWVKEVKGIENIPEPPFIIASNHASYLDAFIIAKIMYDKFKKKTHYIAKPGRWEHRVSTVIFLDYAGCISTNIPKNEFFLMIKATLNDNGIIGVFPEGERTPDGKIKLFRKGIGRAVLESKVPLIPIALKGIFDVWPSNRKLPMIKKIIKVRIGKAMSFGDYDISDNTCVEIAYDVEKEVRKLFEKL